jgi:hypothetical protein
MIIDSSANQGAPYIFVCYSHADTEFVEREVRWLDREGFSIWYDAALSAGHRWSDELASAIAGASCLLYFVSSRSMESNYCLDEVQFAKEHDIAILPVEVEPVQLTQGLRLTLGGIQVLKSTGQKGMRRRQLSRALASVMVPSEPPVLPTQTPVRRSNPLNIWIARMTGLLIGLGVVAYLSLA